MISFKFKALMLGAPSVGKTSLVYRFVDNSFKKDYSATIGAQFLTKKVEFTPDTPNDDIAQINIWDIGGSSNFIDLRTTFYTGASGALLIFDLTREKTLEELNKWHSEMTQVITKEIPIVIIGNKVDLLKKKKSAKIRSKAKAFAKKKKSIYIETSAKTGENVENVFFDLTRLMAGLDAIKTAKKAKKKKPKKGREFYIVKSRIKGYIKSKGCSTAKTVLNGERLNEIIKEILDKAISSAKADGRKTVHPNDI